MSRPLLIVCLFLAVLGGGCAGPALQPKPRLLRQANVLPLALNDSFSFRKTRLFLHDRILEKKKTASHMISFERERMGFGAVTNEENAAKEGHYFDFWWRAERRANVTVRLEYQQQNLGAYVQAQEVDVPNACGTIETKFSVIGDRYHQDGRVISWRALLIENGKVVALTQSFLWD
jgi:hypothetical protein